MSSQNSNTLKGYFQTGNIPTQDNFSSLIDSNLNLIDSGISYAAPGQITLQSAVNLTGTVSTVNSSNIITGSNTLFLTEVAVNDLLIIGENIFTVTVISSNTSLTVSSAFSATAPAINNATAQVDAGVLLSLANSSSTVNIQLTNTSLNFSSGINANFLTTFGQVSANNFIGSGAGLNNIPVSALTGTLNTNQLPNISAANIAGTLSTSQLPVFQNLILYTTTANITNGTLANINWSTDYGYDLSLSFINGNGTPTNYSTSSRNMSFGVGKVTLQISQTTLFTFNAMQNNNIVAQQQIWINVY